MDDILKFSPKSAHSLLQNIIEKHKLNIRIVKDRKTKLGDFRVSHLSHLITINKGLNKYAFLITLIHEIAHFICWDKYRNNILPHGKEWKREFTILLIPFIGSNVFPNDIKSKLEIHLQNPKASSCNDYQLQKALNKYNNNQKILLIDIPENTIFNYGTKKTFIKRKKIRKRILCRDLDSQKEYLFNPITEVTL